MWIEIRFYADLRDIVGTKSIEWELSDDATVENVFRGLFEEFPRLEERVTTDDGTIRKTVLVRKNRTNVTSYDEPLSDGDRLAITTQIVGG